jgi:hypothetical protein
MITYEKIMKKPQVASSLIGMPLTDFESLYAEFERAHMERMGASQYTRRHRLERRRAVGSGRKHRYDLRDRLLMTLFWLRAYTTYEVLGYFYGLDKTSVEDNLKDVLNTLAKMTTFSFDLPPAEVPRIRSVDDVLRTLPELRLICETLHKL